MLLIYINDNCKWNHNNLAVSWITLSTQTPSNPHLCIVNIFNNLKMFAVNMPSTIRARMALASFDFHAVVVAKLRSYNFFFV